MNAGIVGNKMRQRKLVHRLFVFALTLLAVLSFNTYVFAHHGGTAYDITKPLTLKGTIVELDLINPHTRILVDVPDAKGTVVRWTLETHSPASLLRLGWTKNSLKPGDRITMIISPAKNGLPVGVLSKIILPDGRELVPVAK